MRKGVRTFVFFYFALLIVVMTALSAYAFIHWWSATPSTWLESGYGRHDDDYHSWLGGARTMSVDDVADVVNVDRVITRGVAFSRHNTTCKNKNKNTSVHDDDDEQHQSKQDIDHRLAFPRNSDYNTSAGGHINRLKLVDSLMERVVASVQHALASIKIPGNHQPRSRQTAALHDCVYMLEETVLLLRKAIHELQQRFQPPSRPWLRRLRRLLSAAMTYQSSCLDGLDHHLLLKRDIAMRLAPMSRLLIHSLAILKEVETETTATTIKAHHIPLFDRRPAWVIKRDRMLIGRARPPPNVIVAQRGRGHFRNIGDAVRAAPANRRRRFVVWIRAGTYQENVVIPSNRTNLVFIGDGVDRTVITGNRSVGDGSTTFNSATLAVSAAGFMARDLAVVNTAGPSKAQAVALRVNADHAAFYRCSISGYQDTLYAHSMSQFYRECTVRGTVDFIFGNAAVVLQNCHIEARRPNHGQQNMVTAQGRDDPNQPTGTTLDNCTITVAQEDQATNNSSIPLGFETYLGRPWKSYARVMVMNSYLADVIHPSGWHQWSEPRPLDQLQLVEYQNRGPGANTTQRVPWAQTNVTRQEAMEFAVGELIGGRWLNTTAYPFYYGTGTTTTL